MEYYLLNSSEFIKWLGALCVFFCAISRFNNPRLLPADTSEQLANWQGHLKSILSWKRGQQNLLLRPPRANTTLFRYRLHQILYAFLAVLVYLLLLQDSILLQIQDIISLFSPDETPSLINAGPLVIAAFVVMILPNVPPFLWADLKIRSMLYERALIPAQQLREMHRLKMAPYDPPATCVEQVRNRAITDGFDANDIAYDSNYPTTQSLWSKCAILIEQIRGWEADDHYKTAFAALKEAESEKRSVDEVKEMHRNLMADARVCFTQLRMHNGEEDDALRKREAEFRSNCRILLEKIYILLAGVSLHSHYSDHDRIVKFGKLGFRLEPDAKGPIPDSNDLLLLTILLCTFLVLPLSYRLGFIKALMIGAIMFSSVLTPIILARLCPRMKELKTKSRRHGPNVLYPLLSAVLAAFAGFLISYIGNQFIAPSGFCNYTGYERYINCSYPWSFLHGGIAFLLAIRLGAGKYPDTNRLQGLQRYRQWGDIKDAVICALGMLIITVAIVVPGLETLRDTNIEKGVYWMMLLRITLVSFVLGFIVPTWYRAHHLQLSVNRRKDYKERMRFERELDSLQHSMREG